MPGVAEHDHTHLDFTFRNSTTKKVPIYFSSAPQLKLIDILENSDTDRVFVVCDAKIAKLYLEVIEKALASKYSVTSILASSDEANKNIAQLGTISDAFFEANGTSKSCIVTLGGGAIGNIAGLFASIAYRGIDLIHIPTTLLSQLDSAVDVKQSVNSINIKNSLGSIKPPNAVIINSGFLVSLSDREIRAGLAEAIKHGFAQDMSLVEYILKSDIRDLKALHKITNKTIELKKRHWERNPEIWNDGNGIEHLTHIGHTIGKIFEMIELDYLTHGEAIAHGMVIEAYISFKLGYLDIQSVELIREKLDKLNLLHPLSSSYSADNILAKLYGSNSSRPVFALLKGLGGSETISFRPRKTIVEQSLGWYLK